ncbi:hypothetical protein, partial [Rhodopirellula sp. SWK7]|uniref:hypothetical protein n=1 Tax=Rhodopirellula sp. SWK7 TaxID=595460 RepID=UPI001F1CF55F
MTELLRGISDTHSEQQVDAGLQLRPLVRMDLSISLRVSRVTADITGDGRKIFHFKNHAVRPPVHVLVLPFRELKSETQF